MLVVYVSENAEMEEGVGGASAEMPPPPTPRRLAATGHDTTPRAPMFERDRLQYWYLPRSYGKPLITALERGWA